LATDAILKHFTPLAPGQYWSISVSEKTTYSAHARCQATLTSSKIDDQVTVRLRGRPGGTHTIESEGKLD
jgi:hypothetical protein